MSKHTASKIYSKGILHPPALTSPDYTWQYGCSLNYPVWIHFSLFLFGNKLVVNEAVHHTGLCSIDFSIKTQKVTNIVISDFKAPKKMSAINESTMAELESSDQHQLLLLVTSDEGSNHSIMDGHDPALYDVPGSVVALLSVLYGFISLASLLGNTLVIYVVVVSPRMRTVTNYYIANMALADVIIALFAIPFQFHAALLQRYC